MNKIDLLIGLLIGFIATFIGSFLFITLFTPFDFMTGIKSMLSQGKLGKIITLGTILNLFVFAFLLKLNKVFMARGIILSVIIMTIITLFI